MTVAGLLVDEGLAEMVSCNTDFPAMPSATAKKTEDGKSFERGVPLVKKTKNLQLIFFSQVQAHVRITEKGRDLRSQISSGVASGA